MIKSLQAKPEILRDLDFRQDLSFNQHRSLVLFWTTPKQTPLTATTLAADLLRILLGDPPNTSLAFRTSSGPDTGALIISLNDPNGSGIWSVFKILDKYVETKVLSHPFLVTLNNVRAEETLTTIRRATGDQSVGEGAVSTIRQKDFEAKLKVTITPRVSSLERLNLEIAIDIEDFTTP